MVSLRRPIRSIALAALFAVGLLGTEPPPSVAATLAAATLDAPAATGDATGDAAAAPGALDAAAARAAAGDLGALRAYVAAHAADRGATRLLADFLAARRDFAESEALYLGLLRSAPADKLVHEQLGRLYARQDRVNDAIAQFQASLPESAAYADLVSLHRRIGDLPAFVAAAREAARNGPTDAVAQYGYGVILRRIHEPTEALAHLRLASDLSRRSCAILTEIGNAELDLGHPQAAIANFDSCLAIDRNDYAALVDEAVARIDDDPIRATKQLESAVDMRPRRPEAYVDLGYLADVAGRHAEANARYDKALALDPFFRDAYVDLGYGYFTTGRLDLAEETFLRGLSVSRDDGRIEFLLAETLAKRGKADLATSAFRTAAASDEPDVAAAASQALSTRP